MCAAHSLLEINFKVLTLAVIGIVDDEDALRIVLPVQFHYTQEDDMRHCN